MSVQMWLTYDPPYACLELKMLFPSLSSPVPSLSDLSPLHHGPKRSGQLNAYIPKHLTPSCIPAPAYSLHTYISFPHRRLPLCCHTPSLEPVVRPDAMYKPPS